MALLNKKLDFNIIPGIIYNRLLKNKINSLEFRTTRVDRINICGINNEIWKTKDLINPLNRLSALHLISSNGELGIYFPEFKKLFTEIEVNDSTKELNIHFEEWTVNSTLENFKYISAHYNRLDTTFKLSSAWVDSEEIKNLIPCGNYKIDLPNSLGTMEVSLRNLDIKSWKKEMREICFQEKTRLENSVISIAEYEQLIKVVLLNFIHNDRTN